MPYIGNGPVQRVKEEESTRLKWVNVRSFRIKYNQFNSFIPTDPNRIPSQTVPVQMRQIVTSYLIRNFPVCHSVTGIWTKRLFATMDLSKTRDERVNFRNQRLKWLRTLVAVTVDRSKTVLLLHFFSVSRSNSSTVQLCSDSVCFSFLLSLMPREGYTHYEDTPIQIYWKFHLQNLKMFR